MRRNQREKHENGSVGVSLMERYYWAALERKKGEKKTQAMGLFYKMEYLAELFWWMAASLCLDRPGKH